MVSIHLESDLFQREAQVGLVDQIPVPGVDLVSGNDFTGGRMSPSIVLVCRTNER